MALDFEPDAGDRAASGPTSKSVRVIPTKVLPQGDVSPQRPAPRRSCGFRRGRAQSRGLAFGRGLDLVRDRNRQRTSDAPSLGGSFEKSMASRGRPGPSGLQRGESLRSVDIGAGHETATIARPLEGGAFAPGGGLHAPSFRPFFE